MFKRFVLLASACTVAGCGSIAGDYGLVAQSLWQSRSQPPLPTFSSGLNAKYRYLSVQPTSGIAAVFVLGFERQTPVGLAEVWYSADGVMLETLNGRISRTRGYPVQWASVVWHADDNALVRQRDDLSASTFGITDHITPTPIGFAQIPTNVWAPWQAHAARLSQFAWSHDVATTAPVAFAVPGGWVAQGEHRGLKSWVFSYQCLGSAFCVHLARWPLELDSPA